MSAPYERLSLDAAAASGNAEGDGREKRNSKPRHQRQETTLSDNQESSPQSKRPKGPETIDRKMPSSRSSVSDSPPSSESSQAPQDKMNDIVAQLRQLQQQIDATANTAPPAPNHSRNAGALPSQPQIPHASPQAHQSQRQHQQQQGSASMSQNQFSGLLGGGYSDLTSFALTQHQHQQSLNSSVPSLPQPSIDVSQRLQQSQPNNANNDPIMATLTLVLQQHHEQQRQNLMQQQQLEMQTLHQIQSTPDQQQHLMLLLQLFVSQQQQNQGSQLSSQSSAPSSQDVQGVLNAFVQSNAAPQADMNNNHNVSSQPSSDASYQDFNQALLLQLLAAQQTSQGQQNFSAHRPTGNRDDSRAQGSSLSSTPEGILQLMAQQLNQTQNNASSLVATARAGTSAGGNSSSQVPSRDRNSSTSSGSGSKSSGGSFSLMPAPFNPSVANPPVSINRNIPTAEDAAQMQQQLLTNSLGSNADKKPSQSVGGLFSMEDLRYAFPDSAFDNRDSNGRAQVLPTLLVMEDDQSQLSAYQTLLRYQIEVFRATETDANTHQRGRNKPIKVNQIGVRCRHCAHKPISERARGSSYFPSGVAGVYQAGQNMNSTHFQHGVCTEMGEPLKRQFAALANIKSTSTGAGRAYWAKQAKVLGLEDNEEESGIRFWCDAKTTES